MIVATAGHVDHGKTSLIKHLTGVDTDRLAEEKRRGLTIDLGFAYRRINDEVTLGFIDVPGHSRFINTMIAGVSGIDLGLLVVAADDGPMPQTLEHLSVMRLLGISEFILVVSKTDRVEPERVDAVSRELQALVPECEYPVFPLSNISREGVAELQAMLDERALAFRTRPANGHFRLAVDRAFLLKGIGLVVTGTAMTGVVHSGDELQLQPLGSRVRVRSLRVQDRPASHGQAGDRCALNIAGVEDVGRGHTLATPDSLVCSKHLDGRFSLLETAPFSLKHLSHAKLYLGTRRLACRLYFIENDNDGYLAPGENTLVQLLLEEAVVCCHGDRFLVRDDSENFTLGGGVVLDPAAPRNGKSRPHRMAYLAAMELPTPGERLCALLEPGMPPLDVSLLARSWNLRGEELETLFDGVLAKRFEAGSRRYAIAKDDWCAAEKAVLSLLHGWHDHHPGEKGVAVLELQTLFVNAGEYRGSETLFKAVISSLVHHGSMSLAGGLLKVSDHKPVLSPVEQSNWVKVQAELKKQGMNIPSLMDVALATGLELEHVKSAIQAVERIGLVHKLTDSRYALSEDLLKHARIVVQLSQSEEGVTVISFKNRIGAGRKLAIEILEFFDTLRFTQRRDERRVIIDEFIPVKQFGG